MRNTPNLPKKCQNQVSVFFSKQCVLIMDHLQVLLAIWDATDCFFRTHVRSKKEARKTDPGTGESITSNISAGSLNQYSFLKIYFYI